MNDKQKQADIVMNFAARLTELLEKGEISIEKYKLVILRATKSVKETDFADKVQEKLNALLKKEGFKFSV